MFKATTDNNSGRVEIHINFSLAPSSTLVKLGIQKPNNPLTLLLRTYLKGILTVVDKVHMHDVHC